MRDCFDNDKCLIFKSPKFVLPCLYPWGEVLGYKKGDCVNNAEVADTKA